MAELLSPSNGTAPALGTTLAHSVLVETVFQLYRQIEASSCSQPGSISDHHLLALHSLFQQQLLLQALDLVDQDKVTSCSCSVGNPEVPWEKAVCMVKGSSGKEYVCCISSSAKRLHCSCPSFVYSVKMRKESLMCKHLLAACVAMATHRDTPLTVTQQKWEELWDSNNHTH